MSDEVKNEVASPDEAATRALATQALVPPAERDAIGLLRGLSGVVDAIVSRARFANIGGITFAGARDLYEVCGYKRNLLPADYRSRYRRNAVAARIVEVKPIDTWRGGFEVIDDEDLSEMSPFEKAFDAFQREHKLSQVFERADIIAGLGYYSVILIGAPGDMSKPLTKAKEIAYLSVFAEDEAKIVEFDIDQTSPRFGLPVFYELKRQQPKTHSATNVATIGKRVHWTRVWHVADGLLDDNVFGTPRLERVWNLLDDMEKVTGGGGEAYWMRANQGMHINIDPTLNPTTEELDRMEESIEKYKHRMQRTIKTRGANINMLGSDTADFSGPTDAIFDQISAGTGIPKRVLTGTEQGKMAAEQDAVKYYRMIEARRFSFAEALVARPFIQYMIELTALPKPKNNEFRLAWTQLKTRDEEEKANLAKDWATLNNLTQSTVVTADEIREHCLNLPPLGEVKPGQEADGNKQPGNDNQLLPPADSGGLPSDQVRQGPDARKAGAIRYRIQRTSEGLIDYIEVER